MESEYEEEDGLRDMVRNGVVVVVDLRQAWRVEDWSMPVVVVQLLLQIF